MTCGPPAGTSVNGSTLGIALPGISVNPLDTALVNGLRLAGPGVPLATWLLFPNVIY